MDLKEILKEQKSFYQILYSSQNPQVNDSKFDVFFDNDKVEKLNDEQIKIHIKLCLLLWFKIFKTIGLLLPVRWDFSSCFARL